MVLDIVFARRKMSVKRLSSGFSKLDGAIILCRICKLHEDLIAFVVSTMMNVMLSCLLQISRHFQQMADR